MARRARAAKLFGIVVIVSLAGCGGDSTSSGDSSKPSERRSAAVGADLAPLPSELLGSWDLPGGDTVFRTTYYPAGAETCRRLSEPGVGCYTVRGVAGRGAGSKQVFEWGPAGLKDGNLVTIALVAGKPSCLRERLTSSFDVTGDTLTLVSIGDNCLGDRDGDRARARRAPRE